MAQAYRDVNDQQIVWTTETAMAKYIKIDSKVQNSRYQTTLKVKSDIRILDDAHQSAYFGRLYFSACFSFGLSTFRSLLHKVYSVRIVHFVPNSIRSV